MGHVCISVAHSERSSGSRIDEIDLDEHQCSAEQSLILAEELRSLGHVVEFFEMADKSSAYYRDAKPRYIRERGPFNLALEIHHNSDVWSCQYGCVVHWAGSVHGHAAASEIVKELRAVVPWDVKRPWPHLYLHRDRVWLMEHSGPTPTLIVEAGFFEAPKGTTAPGALQFYSSALNREEEAQAVKRGVHRFLERLAHDRP